MRVSEDPFIELECISYRFQVSALPRTRCISDSSVLVDSIQQQKISHAHCECFRFYRELITLIALWFSGVPNP